MPHILIVEDEAAIADTLLYALQAEGFETTWLNLAGPALERLQREASTWSSSTSGCRISAASKPASNCVASPRCR